MRYTPAQAVLLCIDSATSSGVGIFVPDGQKYDAVQLGIVKKQTERKTWVKTAKREAKSNKLPLVVIGEEWTHHGMSKVAFVSLCENWGKWLAELELVDVNKIVRVNPNTWRNAVFGKHRAKDRTSCKKQAQAYITQVLKLPPHNHDIAEAVCLHVWGSRSEEVHQLLEA